MYGMHCKHTFQTVSVAVHHSLKSLCSVRQPKSSEQIFKPAKWRYDCSFWDVCGSNRDLVITLDKINFWKTIATMQAIGKVLHVWQRVLLRGCHQTETMIIATRLPGSIFFGHHVQGRGPWCFWMANNTGRFKIFEFCFCNLKFFRIQTMEFCKNWGYDWPCE